MKILVTGGAGFIGSFMAKRLLDDGHEVVVADSLERGYKEAVDHRTIFEEGNLLDSIFINDIFSKHNFDGVIHFAAYISMGESVENPYIYFQNNIQASLNVIDCMLAKKMNNFIFSSTAGVYGNPTKVPIPEDHPTNPENPYGESKLMVEKILKWYQKTKSLNYVVLRYFNAAGASLEGEMGESHNPETHIIPNIINSMLSGREFNLFGSDYNTKDGTCVRDYIHVLDLVESHILALKKIMEVPGGYTYNVGTGSGFSNLEVINMVKTVSGRDVLVKNMPRRPGDADQLIADSTKIKSELNFSPKYSDLKTIIESAWKWHSRSVQ